MKSHPDGARGGSFFLKEYNHSMAKQSQNKRLVLLDVHAIIHRAYHALPDFV
jgi:hypothetical protein